MACHVDLRFAAKTDTGLVRSHNEDSLALGLDYGLAVLADGMGGYNAGEVASSIATATIKQVLEPQLQQFSWDARPGSSRQIQQMVVNAVERANDSILAAARVESHFRGMGTTVVVVLFHHDKVMVAHVGDSRLYRLRSGAFTLMTRDHSRLQEQIDAGLIDPEQARFSPQRNLITRAVGVEHGLDVEVHEHQTLPGDLYLLCSDGLSDMLSTLEINEILNRLGTELETACDALVQRANDNGGRDNTTVILITVESNKPEAEGLFERMRNWIK
jgi:serine/threonine protein phosphatase PrpC